MSMLTYKDIFVTLPWILFGSASTQFKSNSGDGPEVKVYFGCGCFWHVQHEFVYRPEYR